MIGSRVCGVNWFFTLDSQCCGEPCKQAYTEDTIAIASHLIPVKWSLSGWPILEKWIAIEPVASLLPSACGIRIDLRSQAFSTEFHILLTGPLSAVISIHRHATCVTAQIWLNELNNVVDVCRLGDHSAKLALYLHTIVWMHGESVWKVLQKCITVNMWSFCSGGLWWQFY